MTIHDFKPSRVLGSFSIGNPIGLAMVTLIGLCLRVGRLDFQPLWWDEGYSIFFATRDFRTMLERTAVDIHPPLYYALLQGWMLIFGKGEIAVRLLSVVIGIAAIPLVYALADKLFDNKRAALIAAFLLAISPLHIYYSQEVRMYGLVTLLGIASVYVLVRLLELPVGTFKSACFASVYIAVTTAALYTHYYAAFLLAAEILAVIILLFYSGRQTPRSSPLTFRPLLHWVGAWVAIAALYLPWVVYAGNKLYTYVTAKVVHEAYTPLDPLTYTAQHLAALSVGHLNNWTWLFPASLVLVALALIGLLSLRHPIAVSAGCGVVRHSHLRVPVSPGLLVSLYLLIPLAFGFLVNVVYPFRPPDNERLLLLAAPALYLFAAFGVERLWARRAVFGAGVVLVLTLIGATSLYDFYTVPRYPNDDYRPLIANIQSLAQPGDLLFAIYPWQIGYLESYYNGAPLRIVETPSDRWINNPTQLRSEVDALLAEGTRGNSARVWLPALQTLGRLLEDALDGDLRPRDYVVLDAWYGTTRLELFSRQGDPPASSSPLAFDGLTLSRWGIAPDPITAGVDAVPVWFDAGDHPPASLKLSLRLLDGGGNLWAQDDRGLEGGVQRIGFAVPAGTPPGTYTLNLAIYRSSDSSPLHPVGDSKRGDISLQKITVTAPAQPNLAAVPHLRSANMADGVRLVGYDASDKFNRPGEPAGVVLYWQGIRPPKSDFVVKLELVDGSGKTWATTQASPAHGIYPPSRWQAAELVRDPQTITPRGDTPDGDYSLAVTLLNSQNQPIGNSTTIGTLQVKGRPHYFGAPTPPHARSARFGDVARLVGYDVSVERRQVYLALYWQALTGASTSYTVFAHLVDAHGQLMGQQDHIPGNGAYPTTSWIKGEYLVDEYEIPLSPESANNGLQIEIGLYDARSGERLPVYDDAGQLLGDHILIGVD